MDNQTATIVTLQGNAWARADDGSLRVLTVGDEILAGEELVTEAQTFLELDFGDAQLIALQGLQEITMSPDLWPSTAATADDAEIVDSEIQSVLDLLASGADLTDVLEETAAGNAATAQNGGHSFVSLDRIEESVDNLQFSYNGSGLQATAVPPLGPNLAPEISSQDLITLEDTTLTGQVTTVALNDPTLLYTLVSAPEFGQVILNPDSGSFEYIPDNNYTGPDDFEIQITNGVERELNQIEIQVTPVNDPPVAVDDAFTVAEDGSAVLDLLTNDSDIEQDALSVVAINGIQLTGGAQTITVENGTVSIAADGVSITFTPELNYNGPVNFPYTVSDGNGGLASANVTGTVTPVNDAPTVENTIFTVAEDNSIALDLLAGADDIDGDTLRLESINGIVLNGTEQNIAVPNGIVNVLPDGTVTFIPDVNYNGPTNFPFTVTDGTTSVAGNVVGEVTPVNDAPAALNDSYTVLEDGNVSLNLLSNDEDVDGDILSVTSINGTTLTGGEQVIAVPNGVVSVASDGVSLSFTPSANYFGPVNFPYLISDGNGETATANVDINVTDVINPPVAIDDVATTEEDTVFSSTVDLQANDTDADGDTLSVISGTFDTTQGGSLVIAIDGSYIYTPPQNFTGIDTVDYTVTDGVLSDVATLSISVTPLNDAPVAVDDAITAVEDTAFTSVIDLDANDTDLDGDDLSVIPETLTTAAGGSIVIAADGSYTYTPPANFTGLDSVNYTVTDGQLTDIGILSITVTPVNDAPEAVDDAITVMEDTEFSSTIDLDANDLDLDGDDLSVIPETLNTAQGGTIIIAADGSYIYTPALNFIGTDTVDYTVTDGELNDTATLTITVTPVTDAPIATDDEITVVEDTPYISIVNLNANDFDADGDLLTVVPKTLTTTAGGSIVIAADGSYTYTPALNFSGVDSVEYTVTDGTLSDVGTLTITVLPVVDGLILQVDDNVVNTADGGNAVPPPPATGLQLNFYADMNDLDRDAATQEATLETLQATTATRQISGFGTPEVGPLNQIVDGTTINITEGEAYSVTGLIYLEAGSTYVFSGYNDDAMRLELGGDTLRSTSGDIWGDYVTDSFTASETGYFSLEVYVKDVSGPGDFSLNISVDGGNAQVLNTENFHIYSSLTELIAAGGQFSPFVAGADNNDGGYFASVVNTGVMDNPVTLSNISVSLIDDDGSEVIDSLIISAIPVGMVLSDGNNTFTSTVGATSVDIYNSTWDLNSLQLLPTSGFLGAIELTVTATSKELASNETNVSSEIITVTVVDLDTASGNAGGQSGLDDDIVTNGILSAELDSNIIVGTANADTIEATSGHDFLTGGLGADVFAWELADASAVAGSPNNDIISDFSGVQGDTLDLSDLLQNEENSSLTDYLHFTVVQGDTIVHISQDGGYNAGYESEETNQNVILEGVDLGTIGSDADIINFLLNSGQLTVDT